MPTVVDSLEWRAVFRDEVTAGIGKAQTSFDALAAKAVAADGALGRPIGTLKGLQEGLGKSAGALAAMSSAFGQGESAAGKFGQAAVGLAGAFATGGPLLAGITAATFAGEALYKTWRESEANSRVFRDAVDAIGPNLKRFADQALEPTRRATRDLLEELRNFGKDSRQIAIDDAQAQLQVLEAGQARLQHTIYDAKQKRDAALFRGEGDLETSQQIVDQLEARLQALPTKIAELRSHVDTQTRAALELDAREAGRNKGGAVATATGFKPDAAADAAAGWAAANALAADAQEQMLAERAAKDLSYYDLVADASQDYIDKQAASEMKATEIVTEFKKEQALERRAFDKAVNDAMLADMTQLAQASAGLLIGTAQDFIEARVKGGKDAQFAEEKAAAAALKGIGDQLVAFGTMEAFKAAALGIESFGLDPRAYALGGAATLAIAAGVGMGAGSAAITASIPDASGGTAAAARSPGVGTSSGTRSRDGGAPSSTNITIVYGGTSGPTAEQGAAAVSAAQRKNARRGR